MTHPTDSESTTTNSFSTKWAAPISPKRASMALKLDKLDVAKEKHLLHQKQAQRHHQGHHDALGKVAIATTEDDQEQQPAPQLHHHPPGNPTKPSAPQTTNDQPSTAKTGPPARAKAAPTAHAAASSGQEHQDLAKKNMAAVLKADAEKQMLTHTIKHAAPGRPKGTYGISVQTREAEELCTSLGLSVADVRSLKRRFDENDLFKSGEITQEEFFLMIREERRQLTTGLFQFADVDEQKKYLTFDQYLRMVVTFAAMTKSELYHYVFDLYDQDKSGSLDEHEFEQMSVDMQNKTFSFPHNVATALKMIGKKQEAMRLDGLVDLEDFMKLARKFPIAFFAIMNLQKNVRETTLGNRFWARVTGRKLHVTSFLSHMRRNSGVMPRLTWRQMLWNLFTGDFSFVQARAAELYDLSITQIRNLQLRTGEQPDGKEVPPPVDTET